MREATCKTCPFYMVQEGTRVGDDALEAGYCVRVSPGRGHVAGDDKGWPEVLENDWCGEHPLRQAHRLATVAMQGILANPNTPETWDPAKIAAWAYEQADAMLAAAGKEDSDA